MNGAVKHIMLLIAGKEYSMRKSLSRLTSPGCHLDLEISVGCKASTHVSNFSLSWTLEFP